MSLQDLVSTTEKNVAPRIVFYGTPGVGKTTFGTELNNPIFMRAEEGMKSKEFEGIARLPLLKSWDDAKKQLAMILADKHEYNSLVIDTINWLQLLIFQEIADIKGEEDISEIGYAQGYKKAVMHMTTLLGLLDKINSERKMTICVLAHPEITKVSPPDVEPYDTFKIALHKWLEPLVFQWADMVLFAKYRVKTTSAGKKFDKEQFKGIGTGQRHIFTEERPTQSAKNRYGLPYELPFEKGKVWETIKPYLI